MIPPADCFHTGIIVDDLDSATARFTATSGYEWTRPIEATVPIHTADGDFELPLRFVYSIQAPHLELIQEVPNTIWSAPPGAPIHHLAYWVDDLAAAAAELESAGFRLEARPSGDQLTKFAYLVDPLGVRIELVDRATIPDWGGFLEAMKRAPA
jgi:catechol 2,3-dioxygenase-like lactoylglutathione lyase family enzyme